MALREVEAGNRKQALVKQMQHLKLAPSHLMRENQTGSSGAVRRYGRSRKAGYRTRQDISAGHAGTEVLAAYDSGSRCDGAQRPEPGC